MNSKDTAGNTGEERQGLSEEEYECVRQTKKKDFGEKYMDKCKDILFGKDKQDE